MKVVQLVKHGNDPSSFQVTEVNKPVPKASEVLIKVEGFGLNYADVMARLGQYRDAPPLPAVLGYDVVGIVEAVGQGGDSNIIGKRVVAVTEFGGYAEYAAARAEFVYPLPDNLEDSQAAPLLCAGIIGFRSIRVAGVERGERVGLFGFGASAHLAIAVLRAWNCEVYVSTRGESHRKLAESLGADWVGSEREKPPVALDRAITFAPSGDVVVLALGCLRKGGVVAINAIHLDRMPEFDYDRLLWGERQIRSVANMTRQDAREFLGIAAEIGLKPKVTLFPLEQANLALAAVKADAIDGAAVIVP